MTDCTRLVDRQLRLVELKRNLEQLGERPPPIEVENVTYGPCVLFSRECGSRGAEIAHLVGERLQWQVFDSEIVEQIARRARVRTPLVESVDEHVRSHWRRSLHPFRERAGIKPETYLYHLHEVMLTLGHHGDVVIVGRGAQFVLPAACALRVRVVAPLSFRVARIVSARQWTMEAATEFVQKCESSRVDFIENVFHQDTTSPLNYDLVLNSGALNLGAAADIVLAALQAKLGVRAEAVHA